MAGFFNTVANNYIQLGFGVPTFQDVTQATLMFWFLSNDLHALQEVLCYSIGPPPGVSNSSRNEIEILGDGHIQIDARGADGDAEGNVDSAAGEITQDGRLYHVAVTTDYVNNFGRIYVNGVLIFENTFSAALSSPTSNTTSKSATIAASEDLSGGFVDGYVEDARAYTRILSPAEIQSIYTCQGVDGCVFGLVDKYILDDGPQNSVIEGASNVASRQTPGTGMLSPVFRESIAVTHRRRVP